MTDYFNDQYTSIGQSTVDKLQSTFPSIPDKPIEVPERQRSLSRENIAQETVIEGPNKTLRVASGGTSALQGSQSVSGTGAFTSEDEDGEVKVIIGYAKDRF